MSTAVRGVQFGITTYFKRAEQEEALSDLNKVIEPNRKHKTKNARKWQEELSEGICIAIEKEKNCSDGVMMKFLFYWG